MSRDISDCVPDNIASRIRELWGKHETFVEATGIGYTAVYSVLVRTRGERAIGLLEKISKACNNCGLDEAAAIFRAEIGDARRAAAEKLATKGGITLPELSEKVWGRKADIYKVIKGTSGNKHVPNLLAVVDALELDVQRFVKDAKGENSAA